jgi:hypothetical protein
MPFFVEYSSDETAGRLRLAETTAAAALSRAQAAALGLRCRTAVLLHTAEPNPKFGTGTVIAQYTRTEGWTAG